MAQRKANRAATKQRWNFSQTDARYQSEHAGARPVHLMRNAKIANSHKIPVVARPPLVIRAAHLQGVQPIVVPDPTPPMAMDPTRPANWAALMAFYASRGKIRDPDEVNNTLATYRRNITAVFKQALGVKNPETLDDVSPYWMDPDRVYNAIPLMKMKQKSGDRAAGDLYDASSYFSFLGVYTLAGIHWKALPLSGVQRAAFLTTYKKALEVHKELLEERNAEYVAHPWAPLIEAVRRKFGEDSPQYLYMRIYDVAPIRDDLGNLNIVNTDAGVTNLTKNYLILKSAQEGNAMTLRIHEYKTSGQKSVVSKPLTPAVAALVRAYLATFPTRPAFLFTRKTSHKLPAGAQSTWVKKMLVAAKPSIGEEKKRQAINLLRKSWASSHPDLVDAADQMLHGPAVHKGVYVRPLQAQDEDEDEEEERPKARGRPRKTAAKVVETVKKALTAVTATRGRGRPKGT